MIRHSNSVKGSNNRGKPKKYHGNYLGIVIQNNDPDQRGRVKVYIPHINPSVWNNWDGVIKDKNFKFVGNNIDSDLTNIIDELKPILPWADCASPIIGAQGSGRYNAFSKHATISDTNKPTGSIPDDIDSKYKLNIEGIAESPARVYEVDSLKLSDAFTTTDGLSAPGKINRYSSQYKPTSYSNSSKGSFSVPNVGSHVWVFFAGGNVNNPVYFAAAHGKADWQFINDNSDNTGSIDYPGSYENKSKGDDATYNHNTETYKNKFVFNQKGGVIEIVNTDTREILKLTHYSGSFKEFNNEATIELATGNDQLLVLGDRFSTVRGHNNAYTERDFEEIIRGDAYRKIGTFNKTAFDKWEEEVERFANIKALFETKRTSYTENIIIQKQSTAEGGLAGTAAPCPLCSAGKNMRFNVTNSGPSSIENAITNMSQTSIFNRHITAPSCIERFDYITSSGDPSNFLGSGTCPVCGGTGKSPSTQDGEWDTNNKDRLINQKIKTMISDLALIEKDLGEGGSELINITKHKVETIGLTFNKFPSIRVDDVGKIVHNEMKIFAQGVVPSYGTVPLIEYVHVDDMPGGTYSLNVCNRYNVQVGAGGMSLKSYGPVDIGGTITNIAGEQINIMSDNEVNITGGKHVSISSEILRLRQTNGGQVLVDGNLGVKHNVIIGGGLHVEGELSCQHITAPLEVHETHLTKSYGQLVGGTLIGRAVTDSHGKTIPVYAVGTPMSCYVYEHSHTFNSIPMTYTKTSDDVRKFAQRLEKDEPADPVPACSDVKGSGFNDIGESI